MKRTWMKRLLSLLLVLLLVAGLAGCGQEDAGAGSETAVGEMGEESELVLGKNAFGVSFSVKKADKEPVAFIVEPFADQFGVGNNVFEMDEGTGIWGADALVAGKKKGSQATLEGSFSLYANDLSGPSVTIEVDGTYDIDEEGYCETEDHMFYYLYQGGQFIEADRQTVMGF